MLDAETIGTYGTLLGGTIATGIGLWQTWQKAKLTHEVTQQDLLKDTWKGKWEETTREKIWWKQVSDKCDEETTRLRDDITRLEQELQYVGL